MPDGAQDVHTISIDSRRGPRSVAFAEVVLEHLARIGYKHVEITLRPGWNTEPRLLTRADRAEIRNCPPADNAPALHNGTRASKNAVSSGFARSGLVWAASR